MAEAAVIELMISPEKIRRQQEIKRLAAFHGPRLEARLQQTFVEYRRRLMQARHAAL